MIKLNFKNLSLLIILLGVIIFPFIVKNDFLIHIMIMIFYTALIGESWNILGGYGGQISLGHAAFFGIGAYTSILLLLYFQIPIWIGMFIGAFFAMLLGILIGYPTFKLRGPYFVLATISIPEILKTIFLYCRSITGGAVGVEVPDIGQTPYIGWQPLPYTFSGDPTLYLLFNSKIPYYFIALIMFLSILYITYRIENSKFGLYLLSIRWNEDAAASLGVPVFKTKLKALLISSFFMALGGSFYTLYFRYLDPYVAFSFDISLEVALVSIIGGMFTFWGPLVGSCFWVPITIYLRAWLGGTYAGAHLFIFGVVLMVMILIAPEGILPYIHKLISKISFKGGAGK